MSYKVLMCSFYPVFSGTGGAEKVFWKMANELASRNFDVYALGFDPKSNSKPFYESSEFIKKINAGIRYKKSIFIKLICLFIFNSNWRRKFRDFFEGKRKGKLIYREIFDIQPNIIISYQIEMTYILKDILQLSIPVITMLHSDVDELLCGKQRYFNSLKKSELVQVLMPSYKDKLNKYVSVKSIVVPNVVPSFDNATNLNNEAIIFVGRICGSKNQIDLIEAFNIFYKNHPSWKLFIIGDYKTHKEYYSSCTELVNKYDLQNEVEFVGITKDVTKYLLKSSIFAFPSKFEGFPLALTEAMSMGLVAIGYNYCTGVNEIINNKKNGLLVNNYKELANAMDNLANDKKLRIALAKQAREDMLQYDSERIYNKWKKIIIEVINCQNTQFPQNHEY